MTSEQAQQLVQLQQQLLDLYKTMQPLAAQGLRELFPFLAVLASALLGGGLAWAAT